LENKAGPNWLKYLNPSADNLAAERLFQRGTPCRVSLDADVPAILVLRALALGPAIAAHAGDVRRRQPCHWPTASTNHERRLRSLDLAAAGRGWADFRERGDRDGRRGRARFQSPIRSIGHSGRSASARSTPVALPLSRGESSTLGQCLSAKGFAEGGCRRAASAGAAEVGSWSSAFRRRGGAPRGPADGSAG
jgi:hypothetical protein